VIMRFTLDTTCVIHAVQAQQYGPQIDELVDLARSNRVGLWLTTAFTVDQETASPENYRRNLEWLSQRPVIGTVPGPFRLGYSRLNGTDQLISEEQQAVDETIKEIMLPQATRQRTCGRMTKLPWPSSAGRQVTSSILRRISSQATTPSSLTTATC
jgi:hypothetical protein